MLLADFIRSHGFRQNYLARKLGITPTQFNRICLGDQPLSIKRIYKLAQIMRLPVNEVAAVVIPEINNEAEILNATGTQAEE